MRRSLASDADEGAAWFASVAGSCPEPALSVVDANEIDEPSASLQSNGMKKEKK